jgi:hypothetical protein
LPPLGSADFDIDHFTDWLDDVLSEPDGNGLAVLKATMDESGTHKRSAVVCAAVIVGTKSQWKRLAKDWAPIVKQANYRNGYHAKDCARINPELASIVARRLKFGYAARVTKADYESITEPRFKSKYGSALSFVIQKCMIEASLWCAEMNVEGLAYAIESGNTSQKFIDQVMRGISTNRAARAEFRVWKYEWLFGNEPVLHPPDLASHEFAACYEQPDSDVLKELSKVIEFDHIPKILLEGTVEAWRESKRQRR